MLNLAIEHIITQISKNLNSLAQIAGQIPSEGEAEEYKDQHQIVFSVYQQLWPILQYFFSRIYLQLIKIQQRRQLDLLNILLEVHLIVLIRNYQDKQSQQLFYVLFQNQLYEHQGSNIDLSQNFLQSPNKVKYYDFCVGTNALKYVGNVASNELALDHLIHFLKESNILRNFFLIQIIKKIFNDEFGIMLVQWIVNLRSVNQQSICNIQNQNEKYTSQVDRYLTFDNYIKYNSKKQYWKADISNDEKYFAIFGRKFKKIQLYYLKNKKIIKIIQSDNKEICLFEKIKFSNNSRYLLVGGYFGYLYCFDMNNNFQLIYYQKIHSKQITQIFKIDDNQILTCSYDYSLIISNIKSNQQLLKIANAHCSYIRGIDFDKYDKSIKFFSRKDGDCQIDQQMAHPQEGHGILMIQLLLKDKNLISSDYAYLILWQIDYQRLQLNKLKEVQYNCILNFISFLNHNKIVVICDDCIQILDNDLVVLQQINHNIYILGIFRFKIQVYIKIKQLNSLNYIIIPGSGKYYR